jgi:polysaccharide export outer membrane protein
MSGMALMLLTALSTTAFSEEISPQVLEKIESLPRAQQAALAAQYGFDLDELRLRKGDGTKTSDIALPGEPLEQSLRGNDRQVDEYLLFQEKYAEFQESMIAEDEAPQRYGMTLFDRDISTFAPTDDASVPDNYRLGAGDRLIIYLFGTENDQYDLQISRDGAIALPKLGPIRLGGLTFEDARHAIQERVSEQLLGAEVTVSMGRLRAINVFMAGEVAAPGAYSVSALTTVTQALFQAGGVSEIGSLRNIQVKRQGLVAATFDAYSLLMRGDASGDSRLQSGDVVFVPPYDGIVTVNGAVKRPMIYEFKGPETVMDSVNMAGGFNEDAYAAGVSVISKAVNRALPEVRNIDLSAVANEMTRLKNGDLVNVPVSTTNLKNAVTIEGAVVRPGVYGWIEGQRISDLLGSVDGDLKNYADLGYSLIVRQKNQRLDIEVLQIDLASAILNKGTDEDIATQPRDKIVVFGLANVTDLSSLQSDETEDTQLSLNEFLSARFDEEETTEKEDEVAAVQRDVLLAPIIDKLQSQARAGEPVQTASISGAVKSPGIFPVTNDFNAVKLIAAAGGLEDRVYMRAAELRSLYVGAADEVLSRYVELDLKQKNDRAMLINSRDHLHIRAIPRWNPSEAVVVEGEVKFPGSYRIQKGETLANVIQRAGGLTEDAFAAGTVFTRESIAALETLRARQFAQSIVRDFAASQLTKEEKQIDIGEITSVADKLDEFVGAGRLLVDVDAALAGDQLANIRLEDGDKLTVPPRTSTVTVVGQIRRPGTHSFQQDLDLDDYIGLSAGMTARADDKELYIVKSDGSVLRQKSSWVRFTADVALDPGDTIVVPIDSNYTNNIKLWREITQIVFNSTAGLASIAAATR